MPEFLIILRPARVEMLTEGPTEREVDVVGRHFAYMKALTERGVAVLVGRTSEDDASTIGICVFRAENTAEAVTIMEQDPAVAEGVMTGEVRPFRIALGLGS